MFEVRLATASPIVANAANTIGPITRRRVLRSRARANQKVVTGRPPLSNRDFPAAGIRYSRGLNSPEILPELTLSL